MHFTYGVSTQNPCWIHWLIGKKSLFRPFMLRVLLSSFLIFLVFWCWMIYIFLVSPAQFCWFWHHDPLNSFTSRIPPPRSTTLEKEHVHISAYFVQYSFWSTSRSSIHLSPNTCGRITWRLPPVPTCPRCTNSMKNLFSLLPNTWRPWLSRESPSTTSAMKSSARSLSINLHIEDLHCRATPFPFKDATVLTKFYAPFDLAGFDGCHVDHSWFVFRLCFFCLASFLLFCQILTWPNGAQNLRN